jgi:hypothetical protein
MVIPSSFPPTLPVQQAGQLHNSTGSRSADQQAAEKSSNPTDDGSKETSGTRPNQVEDTQAQQAELIELQKLKNRDREVRAHELAHMAAGGQYITSGAQFSYQKGQDGRLYAIGGEVGIDTSKVPGDPRATLLKAQAIMRAALAPAQPSSQDRQVAASAAVMQQQARAEWQSQQYQQQEQASQQTEQDQSLELQA